MIGKISGRLDWRGSDHVLIDVRGVGYIVYVNDRTLRAMPGVGEAVALYTELVVREDLLQLFGFATMVEKEWHKLLTTVQGVGAKAPMVMAQGASLSAVAELDEVIETTAPVAKRVVKSDGAAQARAVSHADALSALSNLGYGPGDAAQAVATVAEDMPELDTAGLIRACLKLLAPKAR